MTQKIRRPASALLGRTKRQPLPENLPELKDCFRTYFGFTFDILAESRQNADEKCEAQKIYLMAANEKATEAKINLFRNRMVEIVFLDVKVNHNDELPSIYHHNATAQIKLICIAIKIIEKRIRKLVGMRRGMQQIFSQVEIGYQAQEEIFAHSFAQLEIGQKEGTLLSSVTPRRLGEFILKEKIRRFNREFLVTYEEFQQIATNLSIKIARYEELIECMDVGVPLFLQQLTQL